MVKNARNWFTYKNLLLVFVFLVFFFALRWNSFTAPFERDEGVYAYAAKVMRWGENPYEYSFPYKPPMIIYTYYVAQEVFGDGVWPVRLMASIFSLGTVILVGVIAKKEFGSRAGWYSMWLLSVMLMLPVNFGGGMLADFYYAANTEIFMLLPLVGVLLIFIFNRGSVKPITWLLSGVLASIAVNYKPICLLMIVFIYLNWVLGLLKGKNSYLKVFLALFSSFLGFAISFLVIYLPFIVQDGGRAVWNQMVGFSSCYYKMESWDFGLHHLTDRLRIMNKYYWAFTALVMYLLYRRPKRWKFYFGLLLISFFSVYQSLIGHYFLQIMPPLVLVTVYAVTLLEKGAWLKNHRGLLTLFIFISILIPIRSVFFVTPRELGLWVYGNSDPFVEAEFVGAKIASLTNPEDYVFVEGADPEILYFSNRKSSTKMEWTNFFSSDCPALTKYKEDYISDLNNNPPEVMAICFKGSCGYLWNNKLAKPFMDSLARVLVEKYSPVGGWMPDAKGGHWVEPISFEDVSKARTVVFPRVN